MDLSVVLASRGVARRVTRGRRDPRADPPWAPGYPMEGDQRAAQAYLRQLPVIGGAARTQPFGYYQIVLDGRVVGGIGFHGPPRDGLVEIGYGVVPDERGHGVATAALALILDVAAGFEQVKRVCGRTTPDNVASQRVMLKTGMQPAGRDPDFLHFEIEIRQWNHQADSGV
ncbi:MAG TPA: GNAT family N-acetyltransferase [Acidimicrobiales bacterium]|nr:GNAT family N-acetyltransferase [Acidimicrobiales bacterium]